MKRIVLLFGVLLLALSTPGIARAHAELESTTPSDGEVLAAAPPEVTFTFGEDLLPDFVKFVAVDEAGTTTELTVTGVSGPTATAAWPASLPGGTWKIEYRVVSQDGHPVNGNITFSYPAASPAPTSAPPTPSSSSAAPMPTSASPSPPTPSPTTSPAADDSPTNPGWIIAGIVVIALVVIAIIGVAVRRRT